MTTDEVFECPFNNCPCAFDSQRGLSTHETKIHDDPDPYTDRDWLQEQYVEKNKSVDQIVDEFEFSKSTVWGWLDRHNIETRGVYDGHRARKYRDTVDLNDYHWDVIYGSLLGDAYITEVGTFEIETNEREFTSYVMSELPGGLFKDDEPTKYRYHRIQSIVQESFKDERNEWYADGEKSHIPDYVDFTPTVMLHWFLGDGYVQRDKPEIVSNFENTDVAVAELEEWGFEVSCYQYEYDGGVCRVRIDTPDLFYDYIGEPPINCYEHKWKNDV